MLFKLVFVFIICALFSKDFCQSRNNLLDDYNLTGFLPNLTKFFTGVHITKIKKCNNFIGKLKTLEKRSTFAKVTQLLTENGDQEFAKQLISTLPKRKKRKLTNKLDRASFYGEKN